MHASKLAQRARRSVGAWGLGVGGGVGAVGFPMLRRAPLLLLLSAVLQPVTAPPSWVVVRPEEHGAAADGVTDDTPAIRSALAQCAHAGGCTLLFSSGHSYRTGPIYLVSNIHVEVEQGALLQALNMTAWLSAGYDDSFPKCQIAPCGGIIMGLDLRNVTLAGLGIVDGSGYLWWQCSWGRCPPNTIPDGDRPHLMRFTNVHGLRIGDGLQLRLSPNHHIWVEDCVGVRIGWGGGLKIDAPAVEGAGLPGVDFTKGSPNTDGVNIAGGFDTLIENLLVHNNDDCVSVIGSAGGDPHATLAHGGNVIVRNVSCTYSHGLSIGSVTHDVIVNTTFEDCSFINSDNGCRIKAHPNGSGSVSGVTYRDIHLDNVIFPILVYGCYPPTWQCVPGKTAVWFEDILFERISGTAWHGAVFHCDPAAPCRGISLADVDLRPARPKDDVAMSCSNAAGSARNVTPASCLTGLTSLKHDDIRERRRPRGS